MNQHLHWKSEGMSEKQKALIQNGNIQNFTKRERAEQTVALEQGIQVDELRRITDKQLLIVRLLRIYAGRQREYDYGNLVEGFKRLQDRIAHLCGCNGDAPKDGIQFEYSQEKGEENKIVVEVWG